MPKEIHFRDWKPCLTWKLLEGALLGSRLSQGFYWHLSDYWRKTGGGFGQKATFPISRARFKVIPGRNLKATCFKFNCHLFNNLTLTLSLLFHQGNGQTDTLLKQTCHTGSPWNIHTSFVFFSAQNGEHHQAGSFGSLFCFLALTGQMRSKVDKGKALD